MKNHNLTKIAALVFLASSVYAAGGIAQRYSAYQKESELRLSVLRCIPGSQTAESISSAFTESPEDSDFNESVIALSGQYPDLICWLYIPNTGIDYPVVQSSDNAYYLHRDISGESACAGTIFMDYRCAPDMSSRNTIIHGHNMRNLSMFGTLGLFGEREFFDANETGLMYLPRSTLVLEFFAYVVVDADTERQIYNPTPGDDYFDYVRASARHFRDIGIAPQDRIVTLSTCCYEFENARMVLLARIKPSA